MDNGGPATDHGARTAPPGDASTHAAVNTLSVLGFQTWSEQALNTLNLIAAIVGVVAAVILIGALAILYFSGHELRGRVSAVISPAEAAQGAVRPNGQSNGQSET